PCKGNPWPTGDADRIDWLRRVLTETPGRSKILFAHHSRLSRGKHGDNEDVDAMWRMLFDAATGAPLVSLTMGGHDHNVSVYGPRPASHPERGSVAFAQGIHVIVNGAGGHGHDIGWQGTKPDVPFDEHNSCVTST